MEGIENDGFGYSIESGRWLVENENGSIADDGASDPDALTLAPGNRDTALADHSVVSIRQLLDEIVRIRQLCGFDNLLTRGSRFAIRDVLPDRRAEEQRFLQHKSKLPAQGFQLQVAHILAVDADGSRRQLIEARDQTDDRRFARACRPDKCRSLARFDNQINIFQDQTAGSVAEAHVFKFDSALKFRCFVGLLACPAFALHIHHFLDALERDGRFRKIIGQPGQRSNGRIQLPQISKERRQAPQSQLCSQNQPCSVPEHERRPEGRDELDAGRQTRL